MNSFIIINIAQIIEVIGILGGVLLVCGAFFRERTKTLPTKFIKNWLLFAGSIVMLGYATLGLFYLEASKFFVFIESYLVLSSFFMFAQTKNTISIPVLSVIGLGFIIYSLIPIKDFEVSALFSLFGFVILALGYAWNTDNNTKIIQRNMLLAIASILIAVFSYFVNSWIFFILNILFAIFSVWHIYTIQKILIKQKDP